MNGLDLRLAWPALAAWLVAWQGRLLPPGVLTTVAVILLVLAAGALLSRAEAAALIAATLACASAAGLATSARVHARTTGPLADAADARAAVAVEAVLADDPRSVPPKAEVLAFRPLVAVRVRVVRLEVAGRSFRLRQPVLVLTSEESWLRLLPSQRVRVEGRLQDPGRGSDVAALLSARGPPVVLSAPSLVQRAAGRLRSGLLDATSPLPADERGLLPGLVDGDTSRLDASLKEDFRTTGLTHLVAVSGTNVAVVLSAALLLCAWLGVGLRWRPPLAGLVLLGFVVLARPSPSVLRASTMGVIALLALATGTRRQALPALCAAVLVLVLISPDLAAQPGFALSTLATAGLLLVAPVWRDRLARRLPRWLAEALAVPAAAQLACTPVVVALSGQLGLLAVPANLLAVPAVAPATVLGVLAALVAPVWLPAAQALAWLAWVPTHWLVLIARTGARQPGAGLTVATGWAGALTVLCLLIGAAVVLRSRLLRRAAASVLVGTLLAMLALVVVRPGWPPRGWVLVSCDVGQGDGFVVRLGATEALVIDNGPDPEPIDRCLRRLGVRRVPLLMLTHLHADHVEGVPGLLRGRKVGAVQVNGLDEPAVERARLDRWLSPRRIPVLRAQTGERRAMNGVSWEVLDATVRRGTSSDPNNSSVVLRLVTQGVTVLFAGDLETDAQAELRGRGVDLRADVLKVPHHGSAKQDPLFLDAVQAQVALTPVGAGNPYGHPSPVTMRRLTEAGTRTYRSDRDGDVAVVVWDGRITTVARGGDGFAPARASGGHHLPAVLAIGTAVPVALGVPDAALTLCDVPLASVPAPVPVPKARDPPYRQAGGRGRVTKQQGMRRHLLALLSVLALGAGAAVVPGAQAASAPAWQRYPRPAMTGTQLADWDLRFAATYVGRVTATPQQFLARDALVTELKSLGYAVQVETYVGALEAVTATKRGASRPAELVVMGAHFDTLPQSIEGTYDNASGTALVMGLARSFAKVRTQRTLVFSFYNGEEEGALASAEQAKAYKAVGRKVRAYLGFDMVGIAWPLGVAATDKNCLCLWRGARDEGFDSLLAEVNHRFLRFPSGRRQVSIEGRNNRDSDEASWADEGFRTLRWAGLRKAADYPQYHLPQDNAATIDAQAGGRRFFEAGLRNTLLSAYYTAAAIDAGR